MLLPDGTAAPSVESAARHVVVRIPEAHIGERVADILGRLFEQAFDSLEAVYVVDSDRRFLGAVRLVDLFGTDPDRRLAELVDRKYPRVGPHHDQEHVAAEALAAGSASVAVLDEAGVLVGEVPATALLDILRQEHVEDLHRLAGIQRENAQTRSALEAPPLRRARHRLPWLLFGLMGSMVAAIVVSRFERVLQANLAIAFFVPAIVYLADAIGTQTEAIAVRGLSLSRVPIQKLLAGELRTGLLIGFTLAAVAFPIVAVAFGDWRLAFAVAAATVVAGGAATSIGLLLPWFFQRLGSDPAFGSGPVATIIQDLLSLVIYLAIAALIVGT